ncbi:unnamed protein product, partial [Polarella glacialis]
MATSSRQVGKQRTPQWTGPPPAARTRRKQAGRKPDRRHPAGAEAAAAATLRTPKPQLQQKPTTNNNNNNKSSAVGVGSGRGHGRGRKGRRSNEGPKASEEKLP